MYLKIVTTILSDFNFKLRIKAQNIRQTNIILFEPVSRKIYDVFRINVVQKITLLNKIVIPVGENINFSRRDSNKRNKLVKMWNDWIKS